MSTEVIVRNEARRTLAMRLTPEGVVILLPLDIDPKSEQAQRFVASAMAHLPERAATPAEPMSREVLRSLVECWAARLGATVRQVRVQRMRRKWASFSSKGTLTLAQDLLALPREVVEYTICHELLHQRFPDHGAGFRAMLSAWLPDWRERERRLMACLINRPADSKPREESRTSPSPSDEVERRG